MARDTGQLRFRTFRASTLSGAMSAVRDALGDDALLLETRDCDDGIEILAASGTPPGVGAEAAPLEIPPARGSAAEARRDVLAWHGISDALMPALLEPDLPHALTKALRFADLALARRDAPLLLAGEPGAGKTLTTVKLATRLVLAGIRPMVICADGRKAGAVEQLATMTQLLGLTLVVADDPAHLRRAVARRDDEPVLIDGPATTAGDGADTALLGELADAAGAAVTLVLPAGLHPGEAADIAGAFSIAGARAMIASRLDVSRRLGGIVEAAWRSGLPVTEGGVGPGAADGLAPMTAALVAARLSSRGRDASRSDHATGQMPIIRSIKDDVDAARRADSVRDRAA